MIWSRVNLVFLIITCLQNGGVGHPKINKVRWYIFTCIDRVSKLAYVMLTSKTGLRAETHRQANGQVESINKKIERKVWTRYIFSDIPD